MKYVDTDQAENAQLTGEVRKLIDRINNLIHSGGERFYYPDYCVDLMSDHLVQRFGRECLEEAVRQVIEASDATVELSTKYTALCQTFNERYFGNDPRLKNVRVEIRYSIGLPPIETTPGEIFLFAGCEAVMVRQLIERMASYVGQIDPGVIDKYLDAIGAPVWVQAQDRHLSAEEFIAEAEHNGDPSIREEWLNMLRANLPTNGEPVSQPVAVHTRCARGAAE